MEEVEKVGRMSRMRRRPSLAGGVARSPTDAQTTVRCRTVRTEAAP